MDFMTTLLDRNRRIASQDSAAGKLQPPLAEALPQVKAMIIGCADMRVDPHHILGLEPGEAVVLRNIGGRITPGLMAQLGLLGRIGQVAGKAPGGGEEFHVIVLHHTDCGITQLTGEPEMLSRYFQVTPGELAGKSVSDPRGAVAVDVAALRAAPGLPGNWILSGLVYDVATGLIETVAPPKAIAG
jgi:carbonic anhydrase